MRGSYFRSVSLFGTLPQAGLNQVYDLLLECLRSQHAELELRNLTAIRNGANRSVRVAAGSLASWSPSEHRLVEGEIRTAEGEARLFLSDPPTSRMLVLSAALTTSFARRFRDVVSTIANVGELGYGFEFLSDGDNPVLFASGITEASASGYDSQKAEEDQRWFFERTVGFGESRTKRFIDSGMIRNIFPVNYLNGSHSEGRGGASSLAEEVERFGLGSISRLGEKNFVWTIDSALIPTAQAKLSSFIIS